MIIDKNELSLRPEHDSIMRLKGYMIGYYSTISIDKMMDEIKVKLGHNLLHAKGMYILFYVHDDTPIDTVRQKWEEIEALAHKDAIRAFYIEVDDSIVSSAEMIEYEVLLTGINKEKEAIYVSK